MSGSVLTPLPAFGPGDDVVCDMGDNVTWPAVVLTVHRVSRGFSCCPTCLGPWYTVVTRQDYDRANGNVRLIENQWVFAEHELTPA